MICNLSYVGTLMQSTNYSMAFQYCPSECTPALKKKFMRGKQQLSLLALWGNESGTMRQLMIAMSNGGKQYEV